MTDPPIKRKPIYDLLLADSIKPMLGTCQMEVKMISHNIRAMMAKIKLQKKPHSVVIFLIMVRRTYRDLS